jgi:hypothetical protein
MKSVRRTQILAIGLLAVPCAFIVAPGAQAKDRCAYAGAKVVRQTKALRLYSLSPKNAQDRYYICVRSNGRRFRVDNRGFGDQSLKLTKRFVASGKFVAFALSYYASEDIAGLNIVVLNITTGRRKEYLQDIDVFTHPAVPSLVLRPTGSAAWMLTMTPIGSSVVAKREVRRTASNGDALLDSGAGIAPSSLRLSGKTLSWTNAGVFKTATLN